jgi:2-oxoglutarate ferredoxin oxidoreductase subunit delta
MAEMPAGSIPRGHVVMRVDQCKGCWLCIDVCPPHVLERSERVNARGYRYPLLYEGCIACERCLDVCPDFVFDVFVLPDEASA